jgi:23S rRNA (uracil1939-C5)-methyltransferase
VTKTPSFIDNVLVTGYANEGKSIAHFDGKVIFVKGAVPGDTVRLRITRNKKDWMEAEVDAVIQSSAERQLPFCQHFGYCGGCQWQHMRYEAQLRYKNEAVIDTLERLGKITIKEKLPIVGSDNDRYYRNKLEFTFSFREWIRPEIFYGGSPSTVTPALGFHIPGAFDRVFDVKTCYLAPPLNDRIRNAVKNFTNENGYEYFHLKNHTGLMRNLLIRMAITGEVMVLVAFARREEEKIAALMEFLEREFPEINSLLYVVNEKKNDTIYDLEVVTWSGNDFIVEKIGDLQFRISAKSFFQTNTRQAEKLYDCVKTFAAPAADELLYDLYTGTGSIALFLARHCRKVIGIEQVADAVNDARLNATINGIENVRFYVSEMSKILDQSFYAENGMPDTVIADPPRAGMQESVVKELLALAPKKLVYVSCNVATQARDLQMLSSKYSVERIQPFDLFPQTHHVENVAELRRI